MSNKHRAYGLLAQCRAGVALGILVMLGSAVAAGAQVSVPSPQIILTPDSLVMGGQLGSADTTLHGDVAVSDDGTGTASTYTATVQTGTDWLTVGSVISGSTITWGNSVSGAIPGTVRVFVKYGSLSAGVHFGTIAISADGASGNPVLLPITVNVRNQPKVLLRPSSLNFVYQTGYKVLYPAPQTISLFGDATDFSVLTSVDSGNGWLHVNPASSVTPANLTVSVSPSGLAAGVYQSWITLIAPNATNSGTRVSVVLTVTDSPAPTVSPESVSLQAQYGSHQPVFRTILVYTNSAPFVVSPSVLPGTPWLSYETVDRSAGATDGQTGVILPKPAIIKIWTDPTALAVGTYTSSVSIGGGSNPVTVPVTLRVNPNDLIIPQVADGGNWSTVITLVNTDSVPAPFTLKFWQPDGTSLELPLDGIGRVSEYSDTIPVGATRVIQTVGTDATTSQGWAEVIAQGSIGGNAVFRQRSDYGDSEAAVVIAQPQGQQFQLPFDNTENFQTGFAVVNTDQTASNVTLNLRDENGDIITSDVLSLPPHGRRAMLIAGQYPQLANRRGVIEFISPNVALSALGLRFNPGGSFTSFLPVVPQPPVTSVMTRVISQIADGSGWKTTFVLVNPGNQPVQFSMVFRDPVLGDPMEVPLAGIRTTAEYADVIPVGGVRIFQTDGSSAGIVQGWAEIVSSGPIGGTVIFGEQANGGLGSEATVQILPSVGERFVLPFDNTSGFATGLALLNKSLTTNALTTVTVRDENGRWLTTEYLQLNARTGTSFVLTDNFPSTQNLRGSIEFSGADLSALGLLFNPLGSFTSMEPIKK